MGKIKNYEFLARLEFEKQVSLIPMHNGTRESILQVLDTAIAVISDLDKALLKLSADYIAQNKLSSEEAELIYEINAASLAALMVKARIPGQF